MLFGAKRWRWEAAPHEEGAQLEVDEARKRLKGIVTKRVSTEAQCSARGNLVLRQTASCGYILQHLESTVVVHVQMLVKRLRESAGRHFIAPW